MSKKDRWLGRNDIGRLGDWESQGTRRRDELEGTTARRISASVETFQRQKNFILKPGEAINIILPPLGGRVEFRTDPITGKRTARPVTEPAQSAANAR